MRNIYLLMFMLCPRLKLQCEFITALQYTKFSIYTIVFKVTNHFFQPIGIEVNLYAIRIKSTPQGAQLFKQN